MRLKTNKSLYFLGFLLAANTVVHVLLHHSDVSNGPQVVAECFVCDQFDSVVSETKVQTSFTYLDEPGGSDIEIFFPDNKHSVSFPRAPPRI